MRFSQFARDNLDVKVTTGEELYCLCPFHDDSKPSFAFNTRKGVYVCYACGEKGTIKKLLKHLDIEDVGSPSVGDLRSSLDALIEPKKSERTYSDQWLKQFKLTKDAKDYLRSRYLSEETIEEFQLGWDSSKSAITIPLHNRMGDIVGVNRRFMYGDIKYRYPLGFKRLSNLYGYHRCQMRPEQLAITEGCFDALAFWNVGVPAVSIFGSSMSDTQAKLVRMLMPRTVLIATDMDEAGEEAASAVSNRMFGLRYKRLDMSDFGSDPGELSPMHLKVLLKR